jgi:hypothetical protein
MSITIGSICRLAIRPARAAPPMTMDAAVAVAGLGLDGDIHADRLSPRQVLLAGAGVYADHAIGERALHENLLIDVETAQLASGTVLHIGADVLLRLMFQCESCGQLDAQQPGLSRVLGRRRGVLARVLTGGIIRPGDPVRDLGVAASGWSDDWRARVVRILDALPRGCVVDYGVLARLAGVQSSYCRALPGMLSRLGPGYAGRAVAKDAAGSLARWDGAGLFDDGDEVPKLSM